MATIKLVAGAQSGFASLMTTELNSLASGNAVIGSTAISNASNLDLEIEFSWTSGGSITPTGTPFVAVYIYPLNGDGSTYGDGRFGSSAAGPPGTSYCAGFCNVVATAGTQTGTFSMPFFGSRILTPNGTFKPVFYNATGVALSSTLNILYYRTTNRSVA
jgi:hypothetical protein